MKERPSYRKAVSDPLTLDETEEMKDSGSKIRDQIMIIREKLAT